MTAAFETEIDALAAPAEDGGILIWPGGFSPQQLIEENRRARTQWDVQLLGRRIGEWRSSSTGPVILTGHQPSFFHPGVWAKNIVAAALAARLGWSAGFLIVDSDVPHRIALEWPEVDGVCRVRAAEKRTGGAAYESLRGGSRDEWRTFFEGVPRAGETAAPRFVDGFLNAKDAGYVERWTGGMREMEGSLDVASPQYLRISELFSFSDESAAGFTAELILNAGRFAEAYNASLATYRTRRRIRGYEHPVPDLKVDEERIEIPFWISCPEGIRERAFVSRGFRIATETREFGAVSEAQLREEPAKALREALGNCGIRPRALALTLYARLLACDLFIHGIGGAKYDQISDEIIHRYFRIEAPRFACVTATLRLPLKIFDVSEADRAEILRRHRDRKFNPERFLTHNDGGGALLAQRKVAIAEGMRLRSEEPKNRSARRANFEAIRRVTESLARETAGNDIEPCGLFSKIDAQLENNRIARSREWFVGLHEMRRLEELRDRLRGAMG